MTTGQYKSGKRKILVFVSTMKQEMLHLSYFLLRLCKTALYSYSADLVCIIFRQDEETCDYRLVLKSPDYIY